MELVCWWAHGCLVSSWITSPPRSRMALRSIDGALFGLSLRPVPPPSSLSFSSRSPIAALNHWDKMILFPSRLIGRTHFPMLHFDPARKRLPSTQLARFSRSLRTVAHKKCLCRTNQSIQSKFFQGTWLYLLLNKCLSTASLRMKNFKVRADGAKVGHQLTPHLID